MFELPVEAFEYTAESEEGRPVGQELEEEFRRGRRPPARPRPRPYPQRPLVRPWPPAWAVEPAPAPVTEPSGSTPAAPQGSEYVRWVQSALNQILGLQLPLDGIMSPETRSALCDFQRRWRLPADGFVGPDTERALLAARHGGPPGRAEPEALEAGYGAGELEAEVKQRSPDYIRWVQGSLNQIMGLRLAVDGIMGAATRSAIRSFQQRRGLAVDGIVGPQTESAIKAALLGAPITPRQDGVPAPVSTPAVDGVESAETFGFVVRGVVLPPPANLNITNFLDSRIHRFPGRNRRGQVVNEFIVHETVTRSVADTVNVLKRRKLGVHLIMGPDGEITQHGDLADDRLGHAGRHNPASVGIEVVNPYYPRYLQSGLPWTRVINAGWAHEGRYVVPTPQQAEAVARLIGWITSPAAKGLAIPRNWIGLSNERMAMNRVPGAERLRPGIYAHTYFGHADGPWLVLYASLRLEKGRSPSAAYEEAIRLATTSQRYVSLP